MSVLLTILTPTYNRCELLSKCYKSLQAQTIKDFEWLVIDDGSTDNTSSCINMYVKESNFPISYIKKENGGKHTALNVGFSEAKGSLTIILDSDDVLIPNAVETIKEVWEKNKDIPRLSSISFLRGNKKGEAIGDLFPRDEFLSDHIECRFNLGIGGDKSEVYVTEILKKYKFPVFKNEKFMSEDIVWTRMGREYKTLYMNKVIYITEYLEGGLTKSGRKLRIKCPLGGIEAHKEYLSKEFKIKIRIKHALIYVAYNFFAKKNIMQIVNGSEYKLLAISNLIPGFLLYKYWDYKYST